LNLRRKNIPAQYLRDAWMVMELKSKHNNKGHVKVGEGTAGLHPQMLFRDLLVHERKRSERSKRLFYFVTIEIKDVLTDSVADIKVVNRIVKALSTSSREADVKGWYEVPNCIGIIYTDVSMGAIERILDKIERTLAGSLPDDLVSRIGIGHSLFPEEDGKHWMRERSREAVLYPPSSSQKPRKKVQMALKRILDIAVSSLGIMALSPLLLTVALLIKITSSGSVVFKQERVGLEAKKFKFYKFRSMQINSDPAIHQEFVKKFIAGQGPAAKAGETASYKIKDDPRVTGIGRFIRKTSIDELPQLFNVLLGNMSLVGPRPPIEYEVEAYDVWHRSRVVEARPGITGLWQVKGRSRTTFEGMVRMDLEYIRTWSLWLDVKILLKTPFAVINGKGAY
jgi:lipopolysaccharide/colanic/teichoic acid biosynthesis glycosyltransferase